MSPLRRFISFAIIGFVAAELLVRALQPVLGPPLQYFTPVAQAKLEQLRWLDSDGVDIDVLFVGSSTVGEGIDVSTFEDASGLIAYNAALNAADVFTVRQFLVELLQFAHPDTIVYGLSRGAVGDAQGVQIDRLRPEKKSGFPYRLAEHLALYRYRETLRDPHVLETLWLSIKDFSSNHGLIDQEMSRITAHGDLVNRTTTSLPPEPISIGSSSGTEPVPRDSMEELRSIAALSERFGAQLILVNMPATSPFGPLARSIADAAQILGAGFIDATPAAKSTALFYDDVHLNAAGAAQLARFLAVRIDEASISQN